MNTLHKVGNSIQFYINATMKTWFVELEFCSLHQENFAVISAMKYAIRVNIQVPNAQYVLNFLEDLI